MPKDDLSPREKEVLQRVCDGLGYRAVGQELGIVEPTVRCYMERIRGKLGVKNKAQAVAEAFRKGLVS